MKVETIEYKGKNWDVILDETEPIIVGGGKLKKNKFKEIVLTNVVYIPESSIQRKYKIVGVGYSQCNRNNGHGNISCFKDDTLLGYSKNIPEELIGQQVTYVTVTNENSDN